MKKFIVLSMLLLSINTSYAAVPAYMPGHGEWWKAPANPTATEIPEAGEIRLDNIFINTTTNKMWRNTNPTVGSMTWQQLIPYIQADWNESNSSADSYIQNKPFLSCESTTFNSTTTATQLSTTQDANVRYSFPGSVAATLIVGQSITATLKYADDSGMSTNVVSIDSDVLAILNGLVVTIPGTLKLSGIIPKGKYRQVTYSVTGSGTNAPTTISTSEECL